METIKLFNVVESDKNNDKSPYIDYERGLIITSNALWAKKEIINFWDNDKLSGKDLNKTFHKSWKKIQESSRFDLALYQILHYITTYGSDFNDEVYIPNELLEIPDVQLKFKVIRGVSKGEIVQRCLDMIKSGIALEESTLDTIFNILEFYKYKFTSVEGIKNKEAVIRVCDKYSVFPLEPVAALRYIVYKATGTTTLIKNKETIEKLKGSDFDPTKIIKFVTEEQMSTIFNRFKPLFLAMKNTKNAFLFNKLSKLSKKNHVPMVQNPLNLVTSQKLYNKDMKWVDNATIFSIFKAINACKSRIDGQEHFVYRIRNGKSWTTDTKQSNIAVCDSNLKFLLKHLKQRLDFSDKKFFIPAFVNYALPTSEKMFIGNIPTGTRFSADRMAVGVYWRNEWGARDIDLSGVNLQGKVGWNASYSQSGRLMYSGDITSAPDGAVEYLYANGDYADTLVQSNVFSGSDTCDYKIVIGAGDNIDRNYMMNPNKVMAEVACKSVQKQTYLGLMSHDELGKNEFMLLNCGAGSLRVSSNNSQSRWGVEALKAKRKEITLNELLVMLGGKLVDNPSEADYDFSVENISKDSLMNLFLDTESSSTKINVNENLLSV